MSQQMSVFISQEQAKPQWGEKAILSFNEQGAMIHLGEGHHQNTIQKAARKLAGQGIRSAFLQGEGWDLESIWRSSKGIVMRKRKIR